MRLETKIWAFGPDDAAPRTALVRDVQAGEEFFATEKEAILAIADRADKDAARLDDAAAAARQLAQESRDKAGKMLLADEAEPKA